MRLLDAVNLTMPKLGERPVTSLDARHPTLAILLPIVEQTLRRTLQTGWWFNQYEYTAPLNVDSGIDVGLDTIAFIPHKSGEAVQRGTRLFNPQTLSYTFTAPVKGVVIQYVPFDELPDSVANHVYYSALVEAYATDIGMTQEINLWQTLAGSGWSDMLAEHLRQTKHSTRRSRRWRRYIAALQA